MPGSIGLPEIVIVLIIALLVFGPKRVPELGRSLGRGLREFKSSVSGEKREDSVEIENEIDEEQTVEREPAGQRTP
jgi:sec-independent protein translocase protein TatA